MTTILERFITPRRKAGARERTDAERLLYATVAKFNNAVETLARPTVTIVIESELLGISSYVADIVEATAEDYPDHDLQLHLTRPRKPAQPF